MLKHLRAFSSSSVLSRPRLAFFINKLSEMRRPPTHPLVSLATPIISINLPRTLYRTRDLLFFRSRTIGTSRFAIAKTLRPRRNEYWTRFCRLDRNGIPAVSDAYADVFKTTGESGLTTAENSDARCREIAPRRRPCLLNKVTRGSGAASARYTKAQRRAIKRPSASSARPDEH